MKHSSWLVNLGTYTSWFYGEYELTHRESYEPTSSLYDLFPGAPRCFSPPSLSITRVWGMATLILVVPTPAIAAILEVDVTGAHQFHISAEMCHWKPENFPSFGWISWTLPILSDGDFIYFIHFSPYFSTKYFGNHPLIHFGVPWLRTPPAPAFRFEADPQQTNLALRLNDALGLQAVRIHRKVRLRTLFQRWNIHPFLLGKSTTMFNG